MITKEAKSLKLPIFAERFNQLRGDMTQAEFADFLEIARPTVGFYENGERIPDSAVLKRIAEKCRVPADWLLGLSDVRSKDENVVEICQRTGLTQEAVENLLNEKYDAKCYRESPYDLDRAEDHEAFAKTASLLLEDYPSFYQLSRLLLEYFKASENEQSGVSVREASDIFSDYIKNKDRKEWLYINSSERARYDLYKLKELFGSMVEEYAKRYRHLKGERTFAEHNEADE